MSSNFVKKNIKLSIEFDRYIRKHPEALEKIPQKACVTIFLTKKRDQSFNAESRSLAVKAKQRCIEARKEGSRWILEPFVAA